MYIIHYKFFFMYIVSTAYRLTKPREMLYDAAPGEDHITGNFLCIDDRSLSIITRNGCCADNALSQLIGYQMMM